MSTITESAHAFFEAIDTGKGWDACSPYCTADATFAAQAEPLLGIKSLADYAEWMKGVMTPLAGATYDLISFATDEARKNVCAYGVFHATHTGPGGPVPPTGKTMHTDYVYVMQFNDAGKIVHMTKIWHSGLALKEIGWA